MDLRIPHSSPPRDFGGPLGNLALILGLPVVPAYLYFGVVFNGGNLLPSPHSEWNAFLQSMAPGWEAAAVFGAWLLLQVVLHVWVPGSVQSGPELPRGGTLQYKMNGMSSLWISIAVVLTLHFGNIFSLTRIHELFGGLLSVSVMFSFCFATWLYFYGKRTDPYKLSGNVVHDYWMGTGHNPRWPDSANGFDFKFFCEAKPGLVGWMVINLGFVFVQYERHGSVTVSMLLVVLFQFLYVLNHFQAEPFILSTMDIKHEKFGFMLVFGDLVWVPFTYSLQALYLIDNAHDLPAWATMAIVALNVIGFYLFREANLQKHRFKAAQPDATRIWGKIPEFIETDDGKRLLVSGFWAWSRHMNYFGDWIMALAWSLPCMFGSLIPYFYPIYFGILLVQRERRDNEICRRNYGEAWTKYCRRVRWRIIPYVY